MLERKIDTSLGRITVHLSQQSTDIPFIFLHGVYLNHSIWDHVIADPFFSNRSFILVDMPSHGQSKKVNTDWDLDQCGTMLLEILEALQIKTVIAVGHSWGSMVILRSANLDPERFEQVILFNMPYEKLSLTSKWLVNLRHSMLLFPNFYREQAGKSMMAKSSIQQNPNLLKIFTRMMAILTKEELRKTDREILLNSTDSSHLIETINVPYIVVKGAEDYVALPETPNGFIVPGGHISPLEVPDEVISIIKKQTAETFSL